MRIKNVVKVMNFRSLVRVDMAKRNAEKYLSIENEILSIIDVLVNNRNLILDKRILLPDEKRPALNLYIGGDFGFCSAYNSSITQLIKEDEDSTKIVVGNKITKQGANVVMQISAAEMYADKYKIIDYVTGAIKNRELSEFNIIYNQYRNTTDIRVEKRKVYPVKIEKQVKNQETYSDNFFFEGEPDELLINMLVLCVMYEMEVAMVNTKAAVNILRQETTSQSLKKIEEHEQEVRRTERKIQKYKSFKKTISNYVTMKNFDKGE